MNRSELLQLMEHRDALRLMMETRDTAENVGLTEPYTATAWTCEDLEKWIDTKTADMNRREDPTTHEFYNAYDIRNNGTYCGTYDSHTEYNGRVTPVKRDYFKRTLSDKWTDLLSLAFYHAHNLTEDNTPRTNCVIPVSACGYEEREQWEKGQADEDEE